MVHYFYHIMAYPKGAHAMSFKEWLLGMCVFFYGWLIPLCLGAYFFNIKQVFLGIVTCLAAVPIEYYLWKAYKKRESGRRETEAIDAKEFRRKRAEAERQRRERILASPIRNLSPLEFEEYTALYLSQHGYKHVKRTPVTGDYGADILATGPDGKKVCIQCKMYGKPVGIKAVQETHAAKFMYKCDAACVAVTSNGYTHQARRLSRETGVLLYMYDDASHSFIRQR